MTDKPNHRGAPQSPRRAGTPSNKEEPTRNPGNGRPPPGRPESRSMVPSKGYRWRFVFLVPVLTVFLLAGFWLYDEYVAQKSEKERIQGTSPSRPFERNSSKFTMETDHYYRLAPFIVPVTAERTQREKFLKLSVSFSLKSGMMSEEIDRKIVTIRSGITEMLLGKSLSDLQSGEGKAAVRREIQGWLDANLGRGAVDDVFIHEFVLL